MSNKNQAVLLMLLQGFVFSLMQVIVNLTASNIGTIQQVFFRNLISLFIAWGLLKHKKLPLFGPKEYRWPLRARSFFGFVATIMLFYASAHARQADVSLLNRTSPIWVCLLAMIFLKEKINKGEVGAIILCCIGAFVAMQPSFDSNILPLLLALLSSLGCGMAYTMITFCSGHVNPLSVIFHFSLFSTLAAGVMMIPSFVVPTWQEFGMLCFIGVLGGTGQIALTYAYQKAPASEVSIYDYAGIIFRRFWAPYCSVSR